MGKSQSLPAFTGGCVRIKITGGSQMEKNGAQCFMFKPGDTVQGVVELDLVQPYEAHSLTIGFCAYNDVHIYHDNGKEKHAWEPVHTRKVLAQFDGHNPPLNTELIPDGYKYEFSFVIPNDSQPSFCQINDRSKFSKQHFLFAQLEPVNTKLYDHEEEKLLSTCSAREDIQIVKETIPFQPIPQTAEVNKEVSGSFVIFGYSSMATHFYLPRTNLYIGERFPIQIKMSNQGVKKRLDYCRATLKQLVSYRVGSTEESYEKKIVREYSEGAYQYEKDKESQFNLNIPSQWTNEQNKMLPVTRHEKYLAQFLAPSISMEESSQAQCAFSIVYFIRFRVSHKQLSDFARQRSTNVSVTLHTMPKGLPQLVPMHMPQLQMQQPFMQHQQQIGFDQPLNQQEESKGVNMNQQVGTPVGVPVILPPNSSESASCELKGAQTYAMQQPPNQMGYYPSQKVESVYLTAQDKVNRE